VTPGGKRILLVEDDDDTRELMAELLRTEGYTVDVASNGALALELLRKGDAPALVIADMHMPVMNGRELLRRLRDEPGLAAVPIVILSGDATRDRDVLKGGASGLVSKPVSIEMLLATVRRFLAGSGKNT
jgi:CheY-like chemotaxis protein